MRNLKFVIPTTLAIGVFSGGTQAFAQNKWTEQGPGPISTIQTRYCPEVVWWPERLMPSSPVQARLMWSLWGPSMAASGGRQMQPLAFRPGSR